MWNQKEPYNFSKFTPADIPDFLQFWEGTYANSVAFRFLGYFVDGTVKPWLEAIQKGNPPKWIQTLLNWRLLAQWAYQIGVPLAQTVRKGLASLLPAQQVKGWQQKYNISPIDIAEVPPQIRQAFLKGINFSLDWVTKLSQDARKDMKQILAIAQLKNENPMGVVPVLEHILRRDLVAEEMGVTPTAVTPEQIEEWTKEASFKQLQALAQRGKAIAATEAMRMANLGILASMREQSNFAYIRPHAGTCPECERLLDGRVFRIETLEDSVLKNIGKPKRDWVASVPQHPFCRHSVSEVPVRFREAVEQAKIPKVGRVLEYYGLSSRKAMEAIGLPEVQGWLVP